VRCESLQFLEYIPPNNDRREKMINCKKLTKSNDPDEWCSFLYSSRIDTQGIYYGLKIMKSIISPIENRLNKIDMEEFKAQRLTFYKRFNESDGFSLLCSTLETLDVNLLLKDVVWLSIFQIIVDIMQLMLEDNSFISTVNKTKKDTNVKSSTDKLVSLCTNILFVASSNVKLDRDLRKCLFDRSELENLSQKKIENITSHYERLETDFYY